LTPAPGGNTGDGFYIGMTSAPDRGITIERHLIFNLCAVASAKSTKARAHPIAKIPKNGRVVSLERGTKQERDIYYADIEWIDEEGYRVSGMFKLFGWNQCPRALGEKMQKRLSKPPKVLYHRRPREADNP
jgi:hypothetical protein